MKDAGISKDLVAASAAPLVLSILAGGDSYGYEIIRHVAKLSGERIQWKDGMLYPVLHRLETQGFVESYWRESETGRKRKYYRLNAIGRAELRSQRAQWEVVTGALNRSWGSSGMAPEEANRWNASTLKSVFGSGSTALSGAAVF